MRGIAIRRGDAPSRFHVGSALFQLQPSMGLDAGFNNFVVVAVTPQAVGHGGPETTAFYSSSQGCTKLYGDLGTAEVLTARERIVGRQDTAAALANLRYLEVPAEREADLHAIGQAAAKAWASEKGVLDPQDYADNNWGLFAARHLSDEGAQLSPIEHNSVDWENSMRCRDYNHLPSSFVTR